MASKGITENNNNRGASLALSTGPNRKKQSSGTTYRHRGAPVSHPSYTRRKGVGVSLNTGNITGPQDIRRYKGIQVPAYKISLGSKINPSMPNNMKVEKLSPDAAIQAIEAQKVKNITTKVETKKENTK